MITREQLEAWMEKQQASLIGRAYDTGAKDEREAFVDWFIGVQNEAAALRPGYCMTHKEDVRPGHTRCLYDEDCVVRPLEDVHEGRNGK